MTLGLDASIPNFELRLRVEQLIRQPRLCDNNTVSRVTVDAEAYRSRK
jgi:hypothetical protein